LFIVAEPHEGARETDRQLLVVGPGELRIRCQERPAVRVTGTIAPYPARDGVRVPTPVTVVPRERGAVEHRVTVRCVVPQHDSSRPVVPAPALSHAPRTSDESLGDRDVGRAGRPPATLGHSEWAATRLPPPTLPVPRATRTRGQSNQ